MAVSDGTGGNNRKPRKPQVTLSKAQWIAARYQYESSQSTVEQLMGQYRVSERSVRARISSEHWQKGTQIANGAEAKLQSIVESKLDTVGQQIAERVGKKYEADLAPWFERQKRLHVKDSMKRIRKRQRRVDELIDTTKVLTAKDAAYIAKSDDTYDNMARRNLGMNDSTGLGGSLSINVLTNQAAVQINQK